MTPHRELSAVIADLKTAGDRVQALSQATQEAIDDRNDILLEALAAGVTQADAARLIGVTRGAVNQIATRAATAASDVSMRVALTARDIVRQEIARIMVNPQRHRAEVGRYRDTAADASAPLWTELDVDATVPDHIAEAGRLAVRVALTVWATTLPVRASDHARGRSLGHAVWTATEPDREAGRNPHASMTWQRFKAIMQSSAAYPMLVRDLKGIASLADGELDYALLAHDLATLHASDAGRARILRRWTRHYDTAASGPDLHTRPGHGVDD